MNDHHSDCMTRYGGVCDCGFSEIVKLKARVAELEKENRILKNEVDDLRSFAKLNTDHAKKILGVHSK